MSDAVEPFRDEDKATGFRLEAIISGRRLESDPRTPPVAQRVVVKLEPPGTEPPPVAFDASEHTTWLDLAAQFPGVRIAPYFSADPGFEGDAGVVAPQDATGAGLDSRRYLAIDVPAEHEADQVATELRQKPGIEIAYLEGGPVPPPVSPDDEPL